MKRTDTQIINKLAKVDASFAISSKDLANAYAHATFLAKDANVSFNQLISLITVAKQITAREGPVIGQALNSIFSRLSSSHVQNALGCHQIKTHTKRGKPRSVINILKDISRKYDELTPKQRQDIVESLGGVRNVNIVKAIVMDIGRARSIYNQVIQSLSVKSTP